jgi:hypothetical protein
MSEDNNPVRPELKVKNLARKKSKNISGSLNRSVTVRWGGDEEIFAEGFLCIPNRFLQRYASLQPPLTPGEALFVLQLMTYKWEEAAPFPSYSRLAKAMGVTHKMTRRYARQLQRKGYLRREFQKQDTNKFDLTGLFQALRKSLPED